MPNCLNMPKFCVVRNGEWFLTCNSKIWLCHFSFLPETHESHESIFNFFHKLHLFSAVKTWRWLFLWTKSRVLANWVNCGIDYHQNNRKMSYPFIKDPWLNSPGTPFFNFVWRSCDHQCHTNGCIRCWH